MDPETHPILLALQSSNQRIVFAESCTGGMISAELTTIPGISQWLCGSAVTYRPETKMNWLQISPEMIDEFSTESAEVTRAMCRSVLEMTEEATLAAAITGHLGPGAPSELDGVVYVSITKRIKGDLIDVLSVRRVLKETNRTSRQREATQLVIKMLTSVI
ncbi:nicotinamide-nucleotide amidohydrolase family protein [bacterium]|nr:nicotinamide-nucleotide amidohydrolase family protein [bacterium]